jgi:hypothetical protein
MSNKIFNPSKQPRNVLEILKWLVFDLVLLKYYSDTLNKKQTIIKFLKINVWMILMSLTVYSLGCFLIAIFDFPNQYPELFNIEHWIRDEGFTFQKFLLYFFEYVEGVIEGGIFSLIFGLIAISMGGGLMFGLAFGLIFSLMGSLSVGLVEGLTLNLVGYLIHGFTDGLALGLSFGLIFGLKGGVIFGLLGGLAFGAVFGFEVTFGFIIGWYLFYFRIVFYPYYFMSSFFNATLDNNVYLKDGMIWLPIWRLKNKLCKDAFQRFTIAKEFVNFLLTHRPLQRPLAMDILHAATAGEWKEHPLNAHYLNSPAILEEQKKHYQPSNQWLSLLEKTKVSLQASENQHQTFLYEQNFDQFYEALKQLREQTLRESPCWNFHYLLALDYWLERVEKKPLSMTKNLSNSLEYDKEKVKK